MAEEGRGGKHGFQCVDSIDARINQVYQHRGLGVNIGRI